jgi:hypothetical protein
MASDSDCIEIGDKIAVYWPSNAEENQDETHKLIGKVVDILLSKKLKHGTNKKYKVYFKSINETRTTRLSELKWSFVKKSSGIVTLTHNTLAQLPMIPLFRRTFA